jgi:hypothetical protein
MKLSKNELLYLMAYDDGEVDDDEIPEVEALIDKSDEAKAVRAQQAALSRWVKDAAEAAATKAGADDIASKVLAQIDELGGAKVIEIERTRAKRELNEQRVKEFGAIAAIAAAVALFYLWPADEPKVADNKPPAASTAAAAPATSTQVVPATPAPSPNDQSPEAVAAAETESAPGIDVQAVESPQHPFSIFYVPGATGNEPSASSVVVWIGEE